MLVALIALSVPADAAEIQVATTVPINVLVDGVPILWDENTGLGVSPNLPAGHHTVESRNLMGKTSAFKEFDLALDDQIRFEYRKKELWHVGTYKIAVAEPAAVTTVVETTTVAAPGVGVGITVSDGHDTVSVGAGMMGGGVVVTDGRNTVSMNAGVQVTETTTTTTTVVSTGGGVPAPASAPVEVAPVVMDSGAFNGLLRQLDNASFSDDKLSVLQTAAANNWLSCEQLGRILDTFDFGGDKVKAVAIAQPSIVDPQNAFMLNDRFSFSSDAQKAQAYFR